MVVARIVVAGLALLLAAPSQAATTLGGFGDGSVRFIQDGTSNTIQLGETSNAAVCFQNASRPSVTDGTSNTLLLTETLGLPFTAGHAYQYAPIQQITDGTSNTIFVGEGPSYSYCLTDVDLLDPIEVTDGTSNTIRIGEDRGFDICFNNVRVGRIADGTSNTIQFGENRSNVCFQNVGVDDGLVASVPVPGLLALLGFGLLGLGAARRRG